MRITIGHKKTGKFLKMVEVVVIDPHPTYDNVLYVTDSFGNFITLTFQSHEVLVACMQDLKSKGNATTYCDIEYVQAYEYTTEDYNRELDPSIFEREEEEYGRY